MPGEAERSRKSLSERLGARIQRDGALTFRDWMHAALYDERDGYYMRPGVIRQGRAGDYRTAPETSPLFAATFANYFMKSYFDLGAPRHWTIVEAGAATGEFARGLLGSLRSNFPGVFAATRYLVDEVSPASRQQAEQNLAEFKDRVDFCSLSEITDQLDFGIIFSNELIDAFPVHRVIGSDEGLRELCVTVNEAGDFVWSETALTAQVAAYCERINLVLAERQVYEVNLEADNFVARAGTLIGSGLLITVDYGAPRNELLDDEHRFGGTLRAFRRHGMVSDVLADPGSQDLTTTVDWTQLQDCGARQGFENLRLERLDQFLIGEGLFEALSNVMLDSEAADIVNLQLGAREMIRPDGLAASFQVLIQRK